MSSGETDIAHALISAVKDFAITHGRAPTLPEFSGLMKGADYKMRKAFGTYTVLIQAAGLTPYKERGAKITNAIFDRDIARHLEEYEPRPLVAQQPFPKIAVLGDVHEPFGHPVVKERFIEFCREMQPDYIVQVGDAVDFLSHSKFPRSHNVFLPKDEEAMARVNLEKLWGDLKKAVPGAKRVMLLGNHGIRPLKRVLEALPSLEHWAEKYLKDFLTFDDVETILDTREEYKIADIAFIHGFKSQLGSHRDHLLSNVVCGHTHVGGCVFRSFRGRTFFELNAGLAADPDSKGLTYTSTKTTGWTLGWAYIDKYGPRFIPLSG